MYYSPPDFVVVELTAVLGRDAYLLYIFEVSISLSLRALSGGFKTRRRIVGGEGSRRCPCLYTGSKEGDACFVRSQLGQYCLCGFRLTPPCPAPSRRACPPAGPVVVVVVYLCRLSALTPPQTPLCGMILEVKASSQWTINDPTATDFNEYQGVHRRALRRSLLS